MELPFVITLLKTNLLSPLPLQVSNLQLLSPTVRNRLDKICLFLLAVRDQDCMRIHVWSGYFSDMPPIYNMQYTQ